jgi:signal transduction histidine kinase
VSRGRRLAPPDHERLEIGARAAAIGLIFTVSALTGSLDDLVVELGLLAVIAVVAVVPVRGRNADRWRPPVEALLASVVISTASPYDASLLPYLVTPALSAGLVGGWSLAVICSGATVVGLLAPPALGVGAPMGPSSVAEAVQWSLLALAVGLLAAWARRLQSQGPRDDESYVEATRLLTQLRDLSLALSGGLDAVSLGAGLLDDLRERFSVSRGWVLGLRPGGVPVPLAFGPGLSADLPLDVDSDRLWRHVVEQRSPLVMMHPLGSDPSMRGAVLPICTPEAVVGIVVVERPGRTWDDDELEVLHQAVDADAVRLDAAQLFDEVRTLATAEERQRLAREIHDGVAQEVASLGYLIDDIRAEAPIDVQPHLGVVRDELTRIVSELRHSIFDLRREIGPGATLTSVLAEHARHVGQTESIAVHLELSESPARLRPAVESELLRIAQEAIANARRHSGAKNLWVTCEVDAPDVHLRVDDDGRGLTAHRVGSGDGFGLSIMRERALRAGCELEVTERSGGGTSVQVTSVGSPIRRQPATAAAGGRA